MKIMNHQFSQILISLLLFATFSNAERIRTEENVIGKSDWSRITFHQVKIRSGVGLGQNTDSGIAKQNVSSTSIIDENEGKKSSDSVPKKVGTFRVVGKDETDVRKRRSASVGRQADAVELTSRSATGKLISENRDAKLEQKCRFVRVNGRFICVN